MPPDNKIPIDPQKLREVLQACAEAIVRQTLITPDKLERCVVRGIYEGMSIGLHLYGRVDITCKPIAEMMHNAGAQHAASYLLTQKVNEFPRENPAHPDA